MPVLADLSSTLIGAPLLIAFIGVGAVALCSSFLSVRVGVIVCIAVAIVGIMERSVGAVAAAVVGVVVLGAMNQVTIQLDDRVSRLIDTIHTRAKNLEEQIQQQKDKTQG